MSRWGRLLGWAGVVILVGWVPLLVGWSHLPDPTATHWGVNGMPDGRMPLWALPLLMIFIVSIGLLTTSLFRFEGRPTAEAFAMVGLMGGLGLALNISIVYLNWDAPTWQDADPFGWLHIVGVLVGAAVGGTAGYVLGRRWYPPPERESMGTPATGVVAEGEVVSWVSTTSVTWPLALLGGFAVFFLFLPDWFKWLALLFIVLALLFSRVYVTVNIEGIQVCLGGRLPVRKISMARIKEARSIDLEPAAWGGWGWRLVPNGSAIVLRRGDAIEVTLENDRRFAVTIDDAATGAALLNGLVARRAARD